MDLVSVIIPTYNRLEFLKLAINSVLEQSWQNFELIIVDDGSTDGTREYLSEYSSDDRLRHIFQENRGPSAARNAGIRAASADLLTFLDSDDRFAPDKLKEQLAAMAAHGRYLISHTQEIWYRRGKILNQKNKHRKDHGDIFARSLELCVVGMSTVMVRRQLFDKVGLFNEDLPCCEDYDLWLRASATHDFLLVDLPLTIKDGGREDQLSWQYRVGMDRFRIAAICGILDSGGLSTQQRQIARDELVRKCTIYGNGCLKHNREPEGRKYLALAAKAADEKELVGDLIRKMGAIQKE